MAGSSWLPPIVPKSPTLLLPLRVLPVSQSQVLVRPTSYPRSRIVALDDRALLPLNLANRISLAAPIVHKVESLRSPFLIPPQGVCRLLDYAFAVVSPATGTFRLLLHRVRPLSLKKTQSLLLMAAVSTWCVSIPLSVFTLLDPPQDANSYILTCLSKISNTLYFQLKPNIC